MKELLEIAVVAAVKAGEEILKVYQREYEVYIKEDNSPLTEADNISNEVILDQLSQTGIPIISEESELKDYEVRKKWQQCWLVDPLDGTREFIKKNGEFTVNIALCIQGTPVLGVIYIPVRNELYYGDVSNKSAYKSSLQLQLPLEQQLFKDEDRIEPSKPRNGHINVVGSKSFMDEVTLRYIRSLDEIYKSVKLMRVGSSIKFCLLADGSAHLYPRFTPIMEWDTAAGQAICNAVGLVVCISGQKAELKYNKERLVNPSFIVRLP